MNNFQSIASGSAELKNDYGGQGSVYEAVRRRRKKLVEKEGINSENDSETDRTSIPVPDDEEEKY